MHNKRTTPSVHLIFPALKINVKNLDKNPLFTQKTFACSNSIIETLEGVKYVES